MLKVAYILSLLNAVQMHSVPLVSFNTRVHKRRGQMAERLLAKDGATDVCQRRTNHHGAGRSCGLGSTLIFYS